MIKLSALSTYNCTEEELLQRLLANERHAFAEIYNRYWQFLFGLAYNRLKDTQAAEDVVHDVFASLWTNRHKPEIRSLKNYLAVAVKYRILKEVRKAALHRLYQQQANPSPLYVATPDTTFDNKRIIELLQKEIETLPEKCRLIFRFSREQGMTVKEIADTMDIAPKTVENQLNKALKRLRTTIKNNSIFIFLSFLFLG
jgi:RNA polymerase sigma-70 factor (family 1)